MLRETFNGDEETREHLQRLPAAIIVWARYNKVATMWDKTNPETVYVRYVRQVEEDGLIEKFPVISPVFLERGLVARSCTYVVVPFALAPDLSNFASSCLRSFPLSKNDRCIQVVSDWRQKRWRKSVSVCLIPFSVQLSSWRKIYFVAFWNVNFLQSAGRYSREVILALTWIKACDHMSLMF